MKSSDSLLGGFRFNEGKKPVMLLMRT